LEGWSQIVREEGTEKFKMVGIKESLKVNSKLIDLLNFG
jgi:hypothetical protein